MDILTTASNSYMTTLQGYTHQFSEWGLWLFFSLLTINIVWTTLWYAFDRHSFAESMPSFIKNFFGVGVFYTIMMNPAWLCNLLKTVQFMGKTLTHLPIDPSSIISAGIGLGNQIIYPVVTSSLLTMGFGALIVGIVYVIVLGVFISIALDLALTLITTTALIAIATFFLGFAALGVTSQIARQTLDVILGNCVKLLGIYLVVAAGSQTMVKIGESIPSKIVSFDPYAWIVAAALLFWLIAKNLPNQLAKIISGAIQESRGTDAAALGMAAINAAKMSVPALKIAGSVGFNAAHQFMNAAATTKSPTLGVAAAIGGSMAHLGKAVMGSAVDHMKHAGSKFVGGAGVGDKVKSIPERMYSSAKDIGTKNTSSSNGSTPNNSKG